MRKTIMQVLNSADTKMKWHQMGAVDLNPVKPFGIYRLSGSVPGITSRGKSRMCNIELWVHDTPGSYGRIDATLNLLERTFDAVSHASADPGENIAEATWLSRSVDLNDDGFKTICKMTSYQLIGRGQ